MRKRRSIDLRVLACGRNALASLLPLSLASEQTVRSDKERPDTTVVQTRPRQNESQDSTRARPRSRRVTPDETRGGASWFGSIRGLSRRPLVRNVATVASGTAAAQAIAIAFTPLITRLYGPDVFGLQGIFMSAVGLASVVAALGYPLAIVLPRADADALSLARLSILVGAVMGLAAAGALRVFGDAALRLLNATAVAEFVYLIPVAMFISVLASVVDQLLIRQRAFGVVATRSACTALLSGAAKCGLGALHPSVLSLIATHIATSIAGAAFTYAAWRKIAARTPAPLPRAANSIGLIALARRHADFPLLRTPQDLINAFSRSLPVLLLAGYFGAGAAGQYALALSVLGMPAALIGTSVTSAFYPRITATVRDGANATALIVKATAALATVGAAPFVTVMLAGPVLFEFVFGTTWHVAGQYAQWLSLWLFAGFANRPAVSSIPALRLQGALLVHELVSVTMRLAALYAGFRFFGTPVAAIAAFSIIGAFLNVVLIAYVVYASQHPRAPDE